MRTRQNGQSALMSSPSIRYKTVPLHLPQLFFFLTSTTAAKLDAHPQQTHKLHPFYHLHHFNTSNSFKSSKWHQRHKRHQPRRARPQPERLLLKRRKPARRPPLLLVARRRSARRQERRLTPPTSTRVSSPCFRTLFGSQDDAPYRAFLLSKTISIHQ